MGQSFNVHRFYSDLMCELEAHARRGGTAIGFGAVAKKIAKAHGLDCADRVPVARLSRSVEAELGVSRSGYRRIR